MFLLFVVSFLLVSGALGGEGMDLRQVIAFAARDFQTAKDDIFCVDPANLEIINLTEGEFTDPGWYQPWEPLGAKEIVVFRQFEGNLSSRVLVGHNDDTKKQWQFEQVSDFFDFACWFTASPVDSNSNDPFTFAFVENKKAVVIVSGAKVVKKIPIPSATLTKWSPTGEWIAVATDSGIILLSPDGVIKKPIATGGNSYAWRPDGQALLVLRDGKMTVVDLDSRVIKSFDQAVTEIFDWSHDGRLVSYAGVPSGHFRTVYILDVSSGQSLQVDVPGDNNCGKWSPDSKLLAFWNISPEGTCTLGVVEDDGTGYKELGSCSPAGYMPPSWALIVED